MPSPRATLLLAFTFLLTGALSLAAAIALENYTPPPTGDTRTYLRGDGSWFATLHESKTPYRARYLVMRTNSPPPPDLTFRSTPGTLYGIHGNERRAWVYASGWPFPCLRWTRTEASGYRPLHLHKLNLRGKELRIPTSPAWPGLFANAALATTALAILYTAAALIARRIRARNRHLCPTPTCRYDRQGLLPTTPCPECGAFPVT